MEAFARFLAHEQDLEVRFVDFLASLNQSRTATLSQVLRCEGTRKLNATWLDVQVLSQRLAVCAGFFSRVCEHPNLYGWPRIPLIFFQKVDPEEERLYHQELMSEDDIATMLYRERYGRFDPDIFHYHTEMSWNGAMKSNGLMFPQRPFSSRGFGGKWLDSPMILGYWLPDYPRILGVCNRIATDYLARILIHDIGHGFIPSPPLEREDLHSITMQYALGARGVLGKNIWERLVHAEAVDPYFFLRSEEEIRRVWRFGHHYTRTSSQWYFLRGLQQMYSPEANKARERLWRVNRLKTRDKKEDRIRDTVHEMMANGFVDYDPLKEL